MGLHHFRNSTAAVKKYEPVVTSYSDINLILPPALTKNELFIEHVQQIDGLDNLYPNIPTINQQYYQSTRTYAGMPTSTNVDLTVTMTQNLDNTHVNYIYNTVMEWFRLIYDEKTAQKSLKVDYCGSGLITQYDRDDSIWRELILSMCYVTGQPTGLGGINTVPDNNAATLQFHLMVDVAEIRTRGIDF